MSKSRCAWVREGEVAHPARARLRVRAARGTRITWEAQPRRLWRGPQHKGQKRPGARVEGEVEKTGVFCQFHR